MLFPKRKRGYPKYQFDEDTLRYFQANMNTVAGSNGFPRKVSKIIDSFIRSVKACERWSKDDFIFLFRNIADGSDYDSTSFMYNVKIEPGNNLKETFAIEDISGITHKKLDGIYANDGNSYILSGFVPSMYTNYSLYDAQITVAINKNMNGYSMFGAINSFTLYEIGAQIIDGGKITINTTNDHNTAFSNDIMGSDGDYIFTFNIVRKFIDGIETQMLEVYKTNPDGTLIGLITIPYDVIGIPSGYWGILNQYICDQGQWNIANTETHLYFFSAGRSFQSEQEISDYHNAIRAYLNSMLEYGSQPS